MKSAVPTALIVDDDVRHTRSLSASLRKAGFEVVVGEDSIGAEPAPAIAFLSLDLPHLDALELLRDVGLSNTIETVLMASSDDPKRVRAGIANGATYFFCKPFDAGFLDALLADVFSEATRAATSVDAPATNALDQFGQLRGSSQPMRKLFRMLRKVAPTETSVLLIGESGTGKELVARTLHQLSEVADGPFVAFNCAAVPKDLFESELFGHEKGSFSGATQRHLGFFERAEGGTLFLDEITEMPVELQVKLLRVLEESRFRRVGGEVDIDSTVRIVAATNRVPEDAIEEGQLREDLYYRIARFPVHLPPLRNRGDDIAGLTQYFLNELNEQNHTGVVIDAAACTQLERYHWPGNVRELRSVIERAFILAESTIMASHLPPLDDEPRGDQLRISVGESIEDAERKLIFATLKASGGDKKAAAERLGLSLRTLYSRLSHYADEDSQTRES